MKASKKFNDVFAQAHSFVLECRAKGLQVPYSDLEILNNWVQLAPDEEILYVALTDLLPEFYERHAEKTHPPSLQAIDKKMRQRLEEMTRRWIDCR